ncbi:hypothetical protein ACLSU7_01815 [Bdellovibrio sp. HCB185ZH]|uniref:hypothetical protein n=1 Tax=Bdellovibrio sp. HCB185ZH TaxID=3394235 RepID=UPI0039A73CD9
MHYVVYFQTIYFAVTGIWPLLHRRSFEAVTGRKTDWWLVEMVGVLTVSISAALLYTFLQQEYLTTKLIGIASAVSYVFIDVKYVLKSVISKVYLADAAIQVLLIILLSLLI